VLSKLWPIHVSSLEQKWPMYTLPLVAEQPMRWVSLLLSFYCVLAQLSVFRFMHHSPENRGAYVDTQKCSKDVLSIMNELKTSWTWWRSNGMTKQ
jgi:hypothetical protein